MRILITNGRAPAGLELARLLKASHHQVFVVDSFPFHVSKHSSAVKRNFLVPPPRQEKALYLKSLNQIIQDYNIDLLIPVYEESFHVGLIQEQIKGCPVFIDKMEKLRELHHKGQFAKLCLNFGLKMPKAKPSMYLDHLSKRKSEIDFINGRVEIMGEELNIKTPYNFILSSIVRQKELIF